MNSTGCGPLPSQPQQVAPVCTSLTLQTSEHSAHVSSDVLRDPVPLSCLTKLTGAVPRCLNPVTVTFPQCVRNES